MQFDVKDGRQPAINDWFRSPELVHAGKEPYHCFFQSFETVEDAVEREKDDRTVSLNGQWRFLYCRDIHTHVKGMECRGYDDTGWDWIQVPGCWQGRKYEKPLYSSARTPFQPVRDLLCPPEVVDSYNSMAMYRKHFTLPKGWDGAQTFVRFEGVESAFGLWVNGYFAGWSQNSFAPSEFRITDYLESGDNVICCQVYRWCAGSHLEDQDMWRLSGIFRDVSLISRPDVSILDFQVKTLPDSSYENFDLKVLVKISNHTRVKQSPYFVEALLFDDKKQAVGNTPLAQGYTGSENPDWPVNTWRTWPTDPKFMFANSIRSVYLNARVSSPRKWSAEDPCLYTLVLVLKNEAGAVEEVIRKKIGFRSVEVKDGQICVNGSPVLLKGTNYHEFSPDHLRAITREEMVRDILLMKRHNINAVRNSHYPHQALWYELCDEYGMYVMDEGNLETHEISYKDDVLPGNDLRYTFACIDRAAAMVQVSKNSPSVIIWSMGNECGYGENVALMAAYCRTMDGTRLIHKRQMNAIADMDSETYPGVDWIVKRAKQRPDRPFILNEYAHSMGNAMGNFKEYWDAIEAYPCLCGAFIWEWCDHGIADTDEQGRSIFAYGSDYPAEINCGNFCIDGVVRPDRAETAKLKEVKYVQQFIHAKAEDVNRGRIVVANGYSHMGLEGFVMNWRVSADGNTLASGTVDHLTAEPGKTMEICLGYDAQKDWNEAGEYYLDLSFQLKQDTPWAEKGYEMAREQFFIRECPAEKTKEPRGSDSHPSFWACDGEETIRIGGTGFLYQFSKKEGEFCSIQYRGKEMLASQPSGCGPRLNVFRAPTDNDRHSPSGIGEHGWMKWDLARMDREVREAKLLIRMDQSCDIKASVLCRCGSDTGFWHYTVYHVDEQGTLTARNFIKPFGDLETLPRIGVRLVLWKGLEHLTWFGRGPWESYPDRKESAKVGRYTSTVTDQNEHYVRPQEMGNKEDVRFLALMDEEGDGLCVAGSELFSFSALHMTAEDLDETLHDAQLSPREATILSLDKRQNGLGNSSCGGDVMEKYRLKPLDTEFVFAVSPVVSGNIVRPVCDERTPKADQVFQIDESLSCAFSEREEREPFDPSDEKERKRAGY